MYRNVFDVLEERGYFSQATHRDEIYELLSKPGVSFYIGFLLWDVASIYYSNMMII